MRICGKVGERANEKGKFKMFYKVVRQFKQADDPEQWREYLRFSGLDQIEAFCSLDGMFNYSLFTPETIEDWDNCVNEDYKIDMIATIDYAQVVAAKYPGARIFGVIIDPQQTAMPQDGQLLGYDILDYDYSPSLLTNWGVSPDPFDKRRINRFALLDEVAEAYTIRDQLRVAYADDPHAGACEVIAVFAVSSAQ